MSKFRVFLVMYVIQEFYEYRVPGLNYGYVLPSCKCKSGVCVIPVFSLYFLWNNFRFPLGTCTVCKLRVLAVPKIQCKSRACVNSVYFQCILCRVIFEFHDFRVLGVTYTFATYFTLSTPLIPRGLHQDDTCKRGVEFALAVYVDVVWRFLSFCSQRANKS